MYNDSSVPARSRLAALFDDGVFTETGSGRDPGVITAYGYINGCPAYAFSQDSTVMSGAVSRAHSEKICSVLELAARNGVPVVGIYDSCGAFIEDGADALNAYSGIMLNMANLSGVVPVVSVISGVCSGTMAVIACSADYSVVTDNAQLYVNANEGGSAAEAASCGAVTASVRDDSEAMAAVRKYLSLMPLNNLSPLPEYEYEAPEAADFSDMRRAAGSVADNASICELYSSFGKSSCTALCTIGGTSAGVVSTAGGKLTSDDCAKITRFVRLCDAFAVPVVTIVDTEGFELSGGMGVRACAGVSAVYADATCAKITLISGKACGAAFMAFAGKNAAADAVFALDNAVAAPVDPVTAAEFLYHDKLKGADDLTAARNRIADEYAKGEGSAAEAAKKGAVDDIVAASQARDRIFSVLDITAGKRLNKRLPKKHSVLPL